MKRLPTCLAWSLLLTSPGLAQPPEEAPEPPPQVTTEAPVDTPRSAAREPAAERPPLAAMPADRPLNAAFLVVDGVYGTELVAPWDVLEHVRAHAGERPAIEVFTVSPDGKAVTTAEGLVIGADYGFGDHPPVDLLVVPSAEGSRDRDLENKAMVAWVKKTGGEARWVMSLCWGAFVLGEAGLLDGRAATTFPADYDRLAQAFPGTDVKVNLSFVHDGKVLTSQGGVRSYEVALYLVGHLYGEETAEAIAGGLLVPWPPDLDGGPDFSIVGPAADEP